MLETIGVLSAMKMMPDMIGVNCNFTHSARWLLNMAYPHKFSNISVLMCHTSLDLDL